MIFNVIRTSNQKEKNEIKIDTLEELLDFIENTKDSDGDTLQRIIISKIDDDIYHHKNDWEIEIYDGYRE